MLLFQCTVDNERKNIPRDISKKFMAWHILDLFFGQEAGEVHKMPVGVPFAKCEGIQEIRKFSLLQTQSSS